MRPAITAIRAIGVEFIRRTVRPLLLIGVVCMTVLLSVGGWLTTINIWWWILEALSIGVAVLFALLVLLVRGILRRAESPLSKPQRQQVVQLVDKLERALDSVKTPYPVIIYYVIRDIVRPRPNAFLSKLMQDSKTLGPDFAALLKELSPRS